MSMPLRDQITSYMREKEAFSYRMSVCTWWFKFHIDEQRTSVIRRELERMECEASVIADRSQGNNIKWWLSQQPRQSEGGSDG